MYIYIEMSSGWASTCSHGLDPTEGKWAKSAVGGALPVTELSSKDCINV